MEAEETSAAGPVFEARRSRGRLIGLLVVLAVLCVIALVLQLPTEGSRFMARLEFALRAVGILGLIVVLVRLPAVFRAPVELRVSGEGILYRPWSDQTVPWEELTRITQRKINIQNVICVHLKDPALFPVKRAQKMATALNKKSGDYGDMNIMIAATDRSIDELKAAIAPHKPIEDG
ncbi:hypothetical protein ACI5KX_03350 [Erythrobacter sp. GH1-10]|uniref:hypothetical protein n=1 Tax=Erythrobacter sp. GH1-10 TaxID=3349334 RepID=UPI003877E66D